MNSLNEKNVLGFNGSPEIHSIRNAFKTFIGDWSEQHCHSQGNNREDGSVLYEEEGKKKYEFLNREDAYKFLFLKDQSVPYAMSTYSKIFSALSGSSEYREWEYYNNFGKKLNYEEIPSFIQEKFFIDIDRDKLVDCIFDDYEDLKNWCDKNSYESLLVTNVDIESDVLWVKECPCEIPSDVIVQH